MTEKFPKMPWPDVVERVAQSTYRLYTEKSMGTGFLISVGSSSSGYMAVIATAWHVVSDASKGTALLICDQSGHEVVRSSGQNIWAQEIGNGIDSAVVIIQSKEPIFTEEQLLPIFPHDVQLARGSDIGWLGFPGIVEPELCFFHGHISGTLGAPPVYLVDGVAINGVSGGPVFDDRCHLIGLVSAYMPNRVDENTLLPGVSWMVPLNFILTWVHTNLKPRTK